MMDFFNATFNSVAAVFVILNALDIVKRKSVAGHTYSSTVFFAVWSAFTIFYYFDLDQVWSFVASLVMFLANASLLALVVRYRG